MQQHTAHVVRRVSKKLQTFFFLQSFLFLLGWPLLIAWGLPISFLSFLGNFIFGPFLTLFLFLSSVLTLFTLLHLPTSLVCALLDYLTVWWTYATSFGSNIYALKATPCPHYLILPVISLAGCMIIHIRTTISKRIIILLSATACIGIALHQQPKPTHTDIAWGKHELSCYQYDNRITIIDPGFARRRKTINTWITFSLLPHLAMTYGRQTFDTLHVQRCTPSVLYFIQTLCKRHMATYVFIHGPISPKQRDEIETIVYATGVTIHTKQHITPLIHAAYVYYAFK